MKPENHEPLQKKSAPKYRIEVLHLFRWSTHTHTLITLTSDLITLTHTHLHSLNHTSSLSHTHISSLSHSLTRTHTHTDLHSLHHTSSLSHLHTHTSSLTYNHSHTHTSSLSPVHCQGVGCTPWRPSGVPWSPPFCRWLLCGRRGAWCTARGSDFCVAGAALGALPRGRMYALASLRCPLVSAGGFRVVGVALAFAWQARRLVHCQGVGCTPWHPSGVLWSPPLLRGRRGTWCIPKGSDVRPGVPPVSLGLRRFCVAGVALRREDYIYIVTETYIIGFLYMCRKHITISPYDHTHA